MGKLPEKCPICGEKMEKGIISTGQGLWWSKQKSSTSRWSGLGEEKLVRHWWSSTREEAYRCLNCKIILFSYGEEKKKE